MCDLSEVGYTRWIAMLQICDLSEVGISFDTFLLSPAGA